MDERMSVFYRLDAHLRGSGSLTIDEAHFLTAWVHLVQQRGPTAEEQSIREHVILNPHLLDRSLIERLMREVAADISR